MIILNAYILVVGNITVTRTIAAAVAGGNLQQKQPLNAATQVVFKNCAPNVLQKLMVPLLMKRILLILQCLYTN